MSTSTPTKEQRFASNGGKGGSAGKNGGKDEDGEGGGSNGKKPKGAMKKKIIMIVVGVLVVGGGGYKFFGPKPPPPPPKGGAIVKMDPLTLNLTEGHYLKIALGIQLVDSGGGGGHEGGGAPALETDEAAELTIEHLSNRKIEEFATNKSRNHLLDELKKEIIETYDGEVFDVFVTTFVTT